MRSDTTSPPDSSALRMIVASLVRGRWWIATGVAISVATTVLLFITTPTRWLSTCRLQLVDTTVQPTDLVARVRGGAVLELLRTDPSLRARLAQPDGAQLSDIEVAHLMSRQIRVAVEGDRETWITAWDVDGGRARELSAAVVEAVARIEAGNRNRRLLALISTLEGERERLQDGLRDLTARPHQQPGTQPFESEVAAARIRLKAEKLVVVESELEGARASVENPPALWLIAEPPVAWHYPLPRRLGPAVLASATLPLLVAALMWLVHDRPRAER